LKNAGQLPHQRARFPAGLPPDAWKAICKALRTGAVQPDADRTAFYGWVTETGSKATLHTFMQCYRDELQREYALRRMQLEGEARQRASHCPRAAAPSKPPVPFAALIAPLF